MHVARLHYILSYCQTCVRVASCKYLTMCVRFVRQHWCKIHFNVLSQNGVRLEQCCEERYAILFEVERLNVLS